jgi:hypothetical protein
MNKGNKFKKEEEEMEASTSSTGAYSNLLQKYSSRWSTVKQANSGARIPCTS